MVGGATMRPAGDVAPRSLDDDLSDLHAVPPPLDPVRAPGAAPFLGRERELATLVGELTAAAGGEGRLIVITGEAGIGKTRLARELAAAARAARDHQSGTGGFAAHVRARHP